ncbi:MAG: putative selenate reductase subunit YgfK [Oscillospiraceae bacterium]|nr:putative selenate reductase subunit YgfK [Oscillospiraceae bacterium]
MSDKMRQIPFAQLMDWILTGYREEGSFFGVRNPYVADTSKSLQIFGGSVDVPFGPAAGPHTQLAQNIVASYVAGSRFFELKTVQILDGEDLPVSKPCILANDECYNVEWSTELYVPQAMDEYIKGWFALKLISREFGLGPADGFVFNMSVGYDLEGIKTQKIDSFIEGLKCAANTDTWKTCKEWALENLSRFKNIDKEYIESISCEVCKSITLSTLHGCPPDEIERIASYLLTEKKLHTFVKCNPTLLGYDYARTTLDNLGFDYVKFDDHHFKADLQFEDAVPMLKRLQALADGAELSFGVKLTNTFPVKITEKELPGEEMYMSGRSLFPLSIEVARRLTKAFDGKLRISFSGGVDVHNIDRIYDTGIWPITLATTLLKSGGYQRLQQLAGKLSGCEYKPFEGVDEKKLTALADFARNDVLYQKPVGQLPERKIKEHVPLLDCFIAPCINGCPLGQDIPAYLRLVGEGKYFDALKVITQRNPLPFITGTICSHRCMDKCTRGFYEGCVHIRDVKLEAVKEAYELLMHDNVTLANSILESSKASKNNILLESNKAPKIDKVLECEKTKENTGESTEKIAIIGGGPAGLSAAYFLARMGKTVTVFEKKGTLGGIVRHVIPDFRIGGAAIDNDIALVKSLGVELRLNAEVESIEDLRTQGFSTIIVAIGAWKPAVLEIDGYTPLGALEFLEMFKSKPESLQIGENVAVIGGGNTAMDVARAAKRVSGVKSVSLIYRRTKRYMPADGEELQLALDDEVEFKELLAPVRLKAGKLVCEQMELGAPDKSGRRSPVATGRTVEIQVDTVIAAVGDQVDGQMLKQFGVPVDEKGRAIVNAETLETDKPGVYMAGDAKRGPATVAEAIADAIRCVEAITGQKIESQKPPGINPDAKTDNRESLNINPNIKAVLDKKGILYCTGDPVSESKRCLECATICQSCVDVCPNRANIAIMSDGKPQVVHIDYMCNECGNCEVFCPYSSAPYKDKFTMFACLEDFVNSQNQGFLLLEDTSVRIRIGGKTAEYVSDTGLPEGIWNLVQAVAKKGYLFL